MKCPRHEIPTFLPTFVAVIVCHNLSPAVTRENAISPDNAGIFWRTGPSCESVFRNPVRGPCFPQYLPPIGEDLRLTIVSSDDSDQGSNTTGETNELEDGANNAPEEKPLDSIGAMYAALRACWVPPPKDSARHGMEYTIRFALKRDGEIIAPPRVTYASHDAPEEVRDVYRDAVNATPLHFTDGMAGAVAGRPIAIRFVDDRTVGSGKGG